MFAPRSVRFSDWLLAAIAVRFAIVATSSAVEPGESEFQPRVADASNEAELALRKFRVPSGTRVEVFAAEPLLANPVAFCFDPQGRAYVVETFRLHAGVTDIRGHMDWLDDDLACRNVADRVAMYRKFLGKGFDSIAKEHDRVRQVVDRDGDGKADSATVFADGFRNPDEGLAAGVLAAGDDVWLTAIPSLWRLRDENGDGVADRRQAVHTGFGVHVGFIGHDLHGLVIGPDGKLYFSIGDRGLRVRHDRQELFLPDTGSVLRCDLDGSHLEVFHSGLRNPQELAFDDFGNLFTGDNNSDSGDQARFVYLMEGGESGWRIGFQFLEGDYSRGPWNAEKLWHPPWEGQAAYIVPPLVNQGNGPSGLCYYPGTGLADRYRGHFFQAEFRGSSVNSGVTAFAVEPKGAGFEVVDYHEFMGSILATDVEFGPDGGLYVSDWVEGWDLPGKGRIYRAVDEAAAKSPLVQETKRLLNTGFDALTPEAIAANLSAADRRARQAAQFALVNRALAESETKSEALLRNAAMKNASRLARLHAIWGLGQIAAKKGASVLKPILALTKDPDDEVRASVARLAGDHGSREAQGALIELLKDKSPRVRGFAAHALGKLGDTASREPILEILRENADRDPFLRHSAVMGLVGLGEPEKLREVARDDSPAARMGVLLAMRRLQDPQVAIFLDDLDSRLVDEAARAIHDVPLEDAFPALAKTLERAGLSDVVARRAINANFRLGAAENAKAVASFAAREEVSDVLRLEALAALADWERPSGRDRVMGVWRPLTPRDPEIAADAVRGSLAGLFAGSDRTRESAAQVCGKLHVTEVGPILRDIALGDGAIDTRVAAVRALDHLDDPSLERVMDHALESSDDRLRATGQGILARIHPDRATKLLAGILDSGTQAEKQAALATLAKMGIEPADALLLDRLKRLATGSLEAEVQLDLLEAVAQRDAEPLKSELAKFEAGRATAEPLAKYRETLSGGDPKRGEAVFRSRTEVSCLRCHKLLGKGGEVGPDLSTIAKDKTREYLLESIVAPNKQIAKGFETTVVAMDSGIIHVGIAKSEDDEFLRLITPEGRTLSLAKTEIDERTKGQSSMPEKIVGLLSKRDLRDLIEFLANQK